MKPHILDVRSFETTFIRSPLNGPGQFEINTSMTL